MEARLWYFRLRLELDQEREGQPWRPLRLKEERAQVQPLEPLRLQMLALLISLLLQERGRVARLSQLPRLQRRVGERQAEERREEVLREGERQEGVRQQEERQAEEGFFRARPSSFSNPKGQQAQQLQVPRQEARRSQRLRQGQEQQEGDPPTWLLRLEDREARLPYPHLVHLARLQKEAQPLQPLKVEGELGVQLLQPTRLEQGDQAQPTSLLHLEETEALRLDPLRLAGPQQEVRLPWGQRLL